MARVWSEIEALDGGLKPAERKLVAACKTGELCVLGGPGSQRDVRAEVSDSGGLQTQFERLDPYWLPDERDPMAA